MWQISHVWPILHFLLYITFSPHFYSPTLESGTPHLQDLFTRQQGQEVQI